MPGILAVGEVLGGQVAPIVTGAFDVARATATLRSGELTVVLPKLLERRGRAHRVTVTAPDSPAA